MNPTLRPCFPHCGPAFMRKEPITPRRRSPSGRPLAGWAFGLPLWETRSNTLRATCLRDCVLFAMAEKSGQSFLVVRLGSLGDLVHTVPAVAALRSSFPEAKIDWVIDRKWASFLELVTGIDAVIPLERRLAGHFACIRRLKRARYECSLDFQGLYKSAALAWLSGAPRRVGFGRGAARGPGAAWF